ncbi:MAG: substrate-binding domain-containing protein [Aquamicrobium sp.]|jgi:urea transport system substrate-binding protein|nr:substrate-binding domain-containing protein [Aquamicrobium sp.]
MPSFMTIDRRTMLAGMAGALAAGIAPGTLRRAIAAEGEFKIGLLIPLSGPAALFGPSNQGCAELAADEANAAGGVLGRKIKLIPTDAGAAPAEVAKSVVRLMLEEKVDLVIGSHDSAVRQAVEATVKGKVPYIYTPVYEGGDCTANLYCLGETPPQQIKPSIEFMMKEKGAKSFYLIGNDYVWARNSNEAAKSYIAAGGGTIAGEEYVPLGAPNRFEEIVTRIKGAKPDVVLITVIGADNVNFNRAFASFGLDKDITRLAFLLEENTLQGIGAESSGNLYSCMAYFANVGSEANQKFKAAMKAKFGDKVPQLSTLGADAYAGVHCAKALVDKAGSTEAAAVAAASQGLTFATAGGTATMTGRHVDKDMYLAMCKGAEFEVVKTFEKVASGQSCPV